MQTLSDKLQQYILRNMVTETELLTEHDERETWVEFALRIGVTDSEKLKLARLKDGERGVD